MRLKVQIFPFFLFCYGVVALTPKEICKRCVKIDECPLYRDMSAAEQRSMLEKFPCKTDQANSNTPFGFASVAKGDDYICCPDANVWGIENSQNKADYREQPTNNDQTNQDGSGNNQPNDDSYNFGSSNENYNQNSDNDAYEPSRWPNKRRPHHRFNGFNRNFKNPSQRNPIAPKPNVPNVYNSNNNNNNGRFQNVDTPNFNNPIFNDATGNLPSFNNPSLPNFNNPTVNDPYNNANIQGQGRFNGNGNALENNLANQQCSNPTIIPPSPESGCCGLEVSTGHGGRGDYKNGYMVKPAQNGGWNLRPSQVPGRYARQIGNEKINISLDNRIIGGKETELQQFPWTVLLKTTFDYGDRKSAFNCGGSLISSRYVLTAAHCVSEEGAKVSTIQVNLAEYDKRTFPRDCVRVRDEGQRCIDNVVMDAEEVYPHPGYDDQRLQNDIALIRLRENVPYTDFIRPICLPPIDIDDPMYSDLRLAVAGWGRNGEYTSQVKQSTVVNLVPQKECSKSYSQLTRKHLCAAGHSGEDTCKGDSGGPLMMLYRGQYYVSGVVSGKRSDSPCGTTVPSLYTNVYHYVDWILQNIRS